MTAEVATKGRKSIVDSFHGKYILQTEPPLVPRSVQVKLVKV